MAGTFVGVPLAAAPSFNHSSDGRRTAAVLPSAAWRAIDPPSFDAMLSPPKFVGGDLAHQLISATMLTDALRRSAF